MSTAESSLRKLGALLTRHSVVTIALISLFAVAVRVAVNVVTEGTSPHTTGDMESYRGFANAILQGDWWDRHVSYREPGYPLFLAFVFKLIGDGKLVGTIANAFLCGLNCVVLYFLGKRLFNAGVGLAAAAWFSIYFHSVHHATMLLRESLVSLLLTSVLLLAARAAQARKPWAAAAAAVALVALVHTDARFLFHVPFLVAYFLIAGENWRGGLLTALVCVGVFAVGMVPWQVRNYQVYDKIVVVNPRTLVIPAPWKTYDDTAPVAGLEKVAPDTREGVRHMTGLRSAIYDFTEFYRIFRFRGEVRANSNTWEAPWSRSHNWSSIVMYGTLVPFFIYGFWLIITKKLLYAYILVLPVFAHTVLHILKWGRYRYRAPIEPVLILVAFFAIGVLLHRWSQRRTTA